MWNAVVERCRAAWYAPFAAGLLALSCLFGAWQGFAAHAGREWDSPLALVLLAVVSAMQGLWMLPKKNFRGQWAAWVLLSAAIALMGWSSWSGSEFGKDGALFLAACGAGVFLRGSGSLSHLVFPLGICFLVLPFLEGITLFLSYPLRLLSTEIAVGLLRIFGVGIQSHLTTIYVGETQIAITDACSGVSQLGVLAFFAYLLMLTRPRLRREYKLAWALLILPIVIFANTIRLLLTIGLFFRLGDRAFGYDIHVLLGYGFVLLSVGLLWGSGRLFFADRGEEA